MEITENETQIVHRVLPVVCFDSLSLVLNTIIYDLAIDQ